ncbi:MAG TPA: NAD-glutamate dehydrogenase domain-containing protein, partial [Gammaproteobacteria bacterium]|nr:NAD-glutamate dehydrogenase domain-containing protein [Gammaproteobacteria bacterium]
MISKTNTRATVHRSAYTDYIGIKLFNEKGELVCERRFIGLFTSAAYSAHPKAIPFLRRKVSFVLERSGLPEKSHAGKDLMHILATLPRDDLFLAPTEDLFDLGLGILHLQERRHIRLFARKDTYGRFISCLVFIPRENFNTNLLDQIRDILVTAFHGLEVGFSTYFSESVLARVHYVIRIDPRCKLDYDLFSLEKELVEAGRSWDNDFKDHVLDYFGEERGNKLFNKYCHAFPAGYREVFQPRNAVFDIDYIESVLQTSELGMSFYRPMGVEKSIIRFKLFRLGHTVPLSDALPMLENMGLRVIGEQPYKITINRDQLVWINDFSMTYAQASPVNVEQVKDIFQEAFRRVWLGDAENDEFNRLVLEAQMNWREISLLRAFTKYLRQIDFTYSVQYIAETLVHNPGIAKLLMELFDCYFNPAISRNKEHGERLQEQIKEQLEEVAILDEDRILRRLTDVMMAALRTNFYQKNADGSEKTYISIKLDPRKIPDMPLPKPRYEIFVYSPQFEGVHLRATKVARGGIRWSDRREDFRTEILGLMRAQQVKNAVIVPGGAKGGFVAKNLAKEASREEILQEGIACYHGFIEGMLDLADNYERLNIVSPVDTVCYDNEDTYLVVAADKGTATFSDIANQISLERQYWLGDAFASGGSTGYDHKKMGITARGAWVSAERQFQELGINVD